MTGLAATEGAVLAVDGTGGVIYACTPPQTLVRKSIVAELPRGFRGGDAAVGPDGSILVCDTGKGTVLSISPEGATHWLDTSDAGFVTGVAVEADGAVTLTSRAGAQ